MPRKGYIKTPEHRAKLSKACKGRVAPNKGIPCSEEQKEKIRRALTGRPSWNLGRKRSAEFKEKLRLAKLGSKVPKDDSWRKKLSESMKKRWQDPEFRAAMCNEERTTKKRLGALHSIEGHVNKWFRNTKPEIEMGRILSNLGIKFIHSYPVRSIKHCYPADFYISDQNLIIEVDGKYFHNYPTGLEIDHIRTSELTRAGFKVIRFWEDEFNQENVNLAITGGIKDVCVG